MMNIKECMRYIAYMISLLKADSSGQFRLKNYEKWHTLLSNMDQTIKITAESIATLDIPEKLQLKLQEIVTHGTINNVVVPDDFMVAAAAANSVPDREVKLCDFYGFGPANSKKFETDGITGADLLFEWETFIKDNDGELMITKRAIPDWINAADWNSLAEHKQYAIKMDQLNGELKKSTKYLHLLNYHQLVGVKHYYNMMEKIPRAELVKLEKVITTIIARMNAKFVVQICGSYRRKCLQSGDIDCLISHPDIATQDNGDILANIVKMLVKCDVIVDHLTEGGGTKYMGFCRIKKGIPRRIDIRIIAWDSFAYAVLYFTGSRNHNKEMRAIAKLKGYKLNEYGMENVETHEKVICTTEMEIFKFLNMPYVEPHERNIG